MNTSLAPYHLRSLHSRIERVREKRLFTHAATGVALAAGVLVSIFSAEALLDWFVDFPWLVRAFIFIAAFGDAGYLLWRNTIRHLLKRPNDDFIALLIEHALPSFSTRFIASIQLARASGGETPSPLVRALLAQTASMAAHADFSRVIDTTKLRRACWIAGGSLVAALVLACVAGSATPVLVARALLFHTPLPHRTHILRVNGNATVGVGEDLKIDVIASGVLPPAGELVIVPAAGASQTLPLTAETNVNGGFEGLIRAPQAAFNYYVRVGDDTSALFHVRVVRRPAVAATSFEQIYPAYTGLAPANRSVGDLTLLAGSKLQISITATMDIRDASLGLTGTGQAAELPLRVDPAAPTKLTGTLDIPRAGLTGFSIHLVDTEGVASGETATYHIDIVPDHPPTVRITYPPNREVVATAHATLLIAFDAEDDFGVASATLHYVVNQGHERSVEFAIGSPARKLVRRYDWSLDALAPHVTIGDVIDYWITVTDNNDVTGPGRATTEHYQARIVSDDEKRLDIANRLRDTMGGLNDLTQSEEALNNSLGAVIFAKPAESPVPVQNPPP